jgi:hypothetical protein
MERGATSNRRPCCCSGDNKRQVRDPQRVWTDDVARVPCRGGGARQGWLRCSASPGILAWPPAHIQIQMCPRATTSTSTLAPAAGLSSLLVLPPPPWTTQHPSWNPTLAVDLSAPSATDARTGPRPPRRVRRIPFPTTTSATKYISNLSMGGIPNPRSPPMSAMSL